MGKNETPCNKATMCVHYLSIINQYIVIFNINSSTVYSSFLERFSLRRLEKTRALPA
jgi:hypothetical protein